MNKTTNFMFALIGMLSLFSCTNPKNSSSNNIESNFNAQYIRTSGLTSEKETAIINSKEDADNYYEANKDRFYLEKNNPGNAGDATIGFLDAMDKYDEEYYQENSLILVVITETSGSNSHLVTNLEIDDKNINISINRNVPLVGTCDMQAWHIIIEVNQKIDIESNIFLDIKDISINNEELC